MEKGYPNTPATVATFQMIPFQFHQVKFKLRLLSHKVVFPTSSNRTFSWSSICLRSETILSQFQCPENYKESCILNENMYTINKWSPLFLTFFQTYFLYSAGIKSILFSKVMVIKCFIQNWLLKPGWVGRITQKLEFQSLWGFISSSNSGCCPVKWAFQLQTT